MCLFPKFIFQEALLPVGARQPPGPSTAWTTDLHVARRSGVIFINHSLPSCILSDLGAPLGVGMFGEGCVKMPRGRESPFPMADMPKAKVL